MSRARPLVLLVTSRDLTANMARSHVLAIKALNYWHILLNCILLCDRILLRTPVMNNHCLNDIWVRIDRTVIRDQRD